MTRAPFPASTPSAFVSDMPKAKKVPMRTFTAFVLDKHKYSIKDPILLYSGTKSPFIGEIVKIEANQLILRIPRSPQVVLPSRGDSWGQERLSRKG